MDRLEKWKNFSQILAAIAVPVVVAVFGWLIQITIAENTVKKDYVQIAVNILSDDSKKTNVYLRAWAVDIIDKNSPVPLSENVRTGLIDGQITIPFPNEPMKPLTSSSRLHEQFLRDLKTLQEN